MWIELDLKPMKVVTFDKRPRVLMPIPEAVIVVPIVPEILDCGEACRSGAKTDPGLDWMAIPNQGKRLKIIGLVTGVPTEFDNKYVFAYDPSFCPAGKAYDGGLLVVTEDPELALLFGSTADALACWNRSFGLRPDGKPNKPLTAFTCVVE